MSHRKPGYLERQALLGLMVLLSLVLTLTALTAFRAWRLRDDARWVLHSHAVKEQIARVGEDSAAAQRLVGGFVVSGDESELRDWPASTDLVHADMDRLAAFVADNPPQADRCRRLAGAIDARLAAAAERASLRRQGFEAANASPVLKLAIDRADAVSAALAAMSDAEEILLEERVARWEWSTTVEALALAILIPVSIIAVVVVVGRVRRGERALRASEDMLRTLVESMPQMVFMLSPDGQQTVFLNQRWLEYSGASPELGTDDVIMTVIHPDDRGKALALWHAAVAGERAFESESRLRRASDGVFRWHVIRAEPLRSEGGAVMNWLGTCTDVDDATRLTVELARSNAELERFARVASHDLQEPLRMVSGFTQLLQRRYQGKLGADADEYIGFALSGVARMKQLIDDLLTLARLGTQARPLTPTNLSSVVGEALENVMASVAEKRAVVSVGELPQVLGDSGQLVQLFQNLVSNALKFSGDGPPHVRIAATVREDDVLVSVADDGIGIAPEHQVAIFEAFARLHSAAEIPGTGIGLAVCRHVVERHGGRIWAESEPGKGSTFYFTLQPPRSP